MIAFKKFITEQEKPIPLHRELQSLGNSYHEAGGSSSLSTTFFHGAKNNHLNKIHKMVTDRGYKKVITGKDKTEYQKNLNDGKKTANVSVHHDGDHVFKVGTITYVNHF